MVQRDRRDAMLFVHNVSDVIVDDVIAAAGGLEHPRMTTSSNVTEQRQDQRTRHIRLVRSYAIALINFILW